MKNHTPVFVSSRWCALVLVLCAVNASAAFGSDAPAEIQTLEEKVLASRRAIKSGHFSVRRTRWSLEEPAKRTDELVTWVDGASRIREDWKRMDAVVTTCYNGSTLYGYHAVRSSTPSDAPFALSVKHVMYAHRKGIEYTHEPLELMLYPAWYLAGTTYHMESFIASPDREDFGIETAKWDGADARKVSFAQSTTGSRVTYWVVPEWSHNVVRMELLWSDKADRYIDSVQATMRRVRDDLWFPSKVVFVRTLNDKWVKQEDLDVTVVSVNETIDPSIFTPATMNVPAGTRVTRTMPSEPEAYLKWDGKQIVAITEQESLVSLASHGIDRARSGDHRRLLFLTASGLLAAGGAAALWWRRKAAPETSR